MGMGELERKERESEPTCTEGKPRTGRNEDEGDPAKMDEPHDDGSGKDEDATSIHNRRWR